jgi:hypothetical protein
MVSEQLGAQEDAYVLCGRFSGNGKMLGLRGAQAFVGKQCGLE